VKFTYQKFWEEEISHRLAEPYALKEFKNRWYIIAKDIGDDYIKSFALDRLADLDTTAITFEYPENFSIEERYRYCFGIIGPNDSKPEDIILSFDPYQGKYIKSLPLHNTQQILIDNAKELRIKLRLYITHDFMMELLSFGDSIVVIKPVSLINMIRDTYKSAVKPYESSL
jgi:predicted DNA-binding transcriptional regulator YafY